MIYACLQALLSYWRRNLLQLFAFLAGLALATALWSGVQAINAEARASYDAAAATLGEGQFDQLLPREGATIAQSVYIDLRRNGWLVSPIIDGHIRNIRIVGLDPLTSPSGVRSVEMTGALTASSADARTLLFANTETARQLAGLAEVQIDPNVAPGVAVGDVGAVQQLLGRNDLTRLIVQPEQPIGQAELNTVAPGLRLQPSQQTADVAQLTDSFHLNLTAFGLLSFAVGLFIVYSTIGLAFEQRRGVIRTLRSLGVPLRLLVSVIIVEMLGLALIGSAIGIVIGYIIAAFLLPDVAATLLGLYGAQVAGTLQLRPEWWLSGLLIGVLGTGAALTGRILQVRRMPLLASVQLRAWAMASTAQFRWLKICAVFLLTGAALLAFVGAGLVAGFALLACLLIGAAFALPALASWLLSQVETRAKSPMWLWFWADTRQQLPGLSLALMALLLAVSANIGVSTMVSSFRLTFIQFLDQRLAPELFVQTETAAQSTALEAYLAQQGLEVLPLMTTQTRIAGQPGRLFGVRVAPTYRENWVFLDATPDAWDRVEAGTAVVVNEQLARRGDIWVGDEVDVAQNLVLPIAAVVGDYGNPTGQVIISETLFETLHPKIFPSQFGVRTKDVTGLRQQLIQDLDLPANAMINQAVIKATSLQIFERTFTVTQALNVLTLGVAGFAMLMSLLTLADLRTPQLAPVWALGLTRRKLGQLELMRAIALSCMVFVCAMPLGLALAWVLLSIINVEAFGWRLPMHLFPVEYLILGGYAIMAALLAAAWPAVRLMRMPPSSLLKVFANER